jgi:DNA processing protein
MLEARAAAMLQRARQAGMNLVECTSPDYPSLLHQLDDAPVALWTRGDHALANCTAVAIVGPRAATPGALAMARQLGRELAASGLVVVSGLARGVDGAAHAGALETGKTIGVLGGGLDVVYPREHLALAERIASGGGALVSEFGPGTPPRPHHFPRRNRIVAGLSLGVVVVEAGETSGALITAGLALDQGKEVMAVPGLASSGRNRGGHALIKDGAALVENARDVLDVLASALAGRPAGPVLPPLLALAGRPETRAATEGCPALPWSDWGVGEELEVEELQELTGLGLSSLLASLLECELDGTVVRTPAGRFVRLR